MSHQFCSLAGIRPFAAFLALGVALVVTAPRGAAGVIPSTAIVSESVRSTDLSTIRQALEHKQVRQRLGELGFTETEIQQRLANASDSELHQLAIQSQNLMAGGDGGIIVTALLIVLLVLLILRIS